MANDAGGILAIATPKMMLVLMPLFPVPQLRSRRSLTLAGPV